MRNSKKSLMTNRIMNKKTIITAMLVLVAIAGQGQTKVTGHVVNERSETVEYVSIGIEEDSVGAQ